MTSLTQKISKALDESDQVVVFTQDINDAADFVNCGQGRWMISHDRRLWEEWPEMLCVSKGNIKKGFKAGILELPIDGDNVLGMDYPGRLVFTKNPWAKIYRNAVVIKPRPFTFPPFTISSHYTPLRAITEVKEGLVLRFATGSEYNQVHDQLLMQNIAHHLYTDGDHAYPMLYRPKRFPVGESAVLYGSMGLLELMTYHRFDRVLLCEEMDTHLSVKFEDLETLLKVFRDAPESVLNEAYISAKTWKHPKSVAKALKFLTRANCVRQVALDNGVIQIHKKGPGPANDALYHLIPEGEITASRLAIHLKVARQELFDFLKKYEGEHLIFSYAASKNQRFYKYVTDIHIDIFEKVMALYYSDFLFVTSLASEGAPFLNRFIDDRIASHAYGNNMRCEIGDDALGPAERFAIPT